MPASALVNTGALSTPASGVEEKWSCVTVWGGATDSPGAASMGLKSAMARQQGWMNGVLRGHSVVTGGG